jgi:hypothetical protein
MLLILSDLGLTKSDPRRGGGWIRYDCRHGRWGDRERRHVLRSPGNKCTRGCQSYCERLQQPSCGR